MVVLIFLLALFPNGFSNHFKFFSRKKLNIDSIPMFSFRKCFKTFQLARHSNSGIEIDDQKCRTVLVLAIDHHLHPPI